jgi:hypothetical protein
MYYATTPESLVENLCDDCSVNDLPLEQQPGAASAALLVRMNMSHFGIEADPERPIRGQARECGLTDDYGRYSGDLTEAQVKAAISCGTCRKVGRCPVKSLMRGTRDDIELTS